MREEFILFVRLKTAAGICVVWMLSSIGLANQPWQPPSVLIDSHLPDELTNIRVRIFPHKRNFPPQFKDQVFDRFRVESDEPCTVYDAVGNLERQAHTVITRVKSISFDALRLRDTVWVNCTGPYKLVREGVGLPSFTYLGPLQIKSVKRQDRQVLQAVIYLSIEQYLKGVVPSEVMAGWPMETLKSQAVAARTYAIFHMNNTREAARHPDFDVDDTVVYQAFTGLNSEHPRTNQAVEETKGQILMFGDKVIQAYYHADSGGVTASAAHAFKMEVPYCKAKQESYRKDLVRSEWQVQLPLGAINQKFAALGHIHIQNPISEILAETVRRSPSGRVKGIDVKLRDGSVIHLGIEKWKRAIALNSSLFEVKVQMTPSETLVTFDGRGSGHGVGLNQMGAKVLADHYGWTYDQILKFYYTGIKVCSIGSEKREERTVEPCAGLSDT